MKTLKCTDYLCLIKLMQFQSADSLKSEIRKKIDFYQVCGLWLNSITIECDTMQLRFISKNTGQFKEISLQ